MGQYYRAYLNNGKEVRVLDPWDNGSTSKLMEHSWIGDGYCNSIVNCLIEMGESAVLNVGDYSEDLISEDIYKRCWGEDVPLYLMGDDGTHKPVYIVCEERGEYIRYRYHATKKDRGLSIPNTLTLLCAVGNGRGGGDYSGINEDLVGAWAGPTLKVVSSKPKGLVCLGEDTFAED